MKTKFITSIAIALVFAFTAQASFGQLFNKKNEKPNSELIPKSAFTAVAAFPQAITSLEALKLFPHEIVSAWGKKEFGFDPMLIKQATFVMKTPDDKLFAPVYAVIFHFDEMQGLAGGMIDKLEKKTIAGKTVFSAGSDYEPSYMIVDEATMVMGVESYFEELIVSPDGNVSNLMEKGSVSGQVFGFLDVKAIEPILNEINKEADQFVLDPPVERMKLIPSLLSSIEAAIETKSEFGGTMILHARSNANAEELNEIIVDGLDYGRKSLLAQMAQTMDMNDPVQVATIEYTKRMYEKYEKQLTPKVDGKDLTITVGEEILALPWLVGLLGSTGWAMVEPEIRMTPQTQLRYNALAFHNYQSAYGKFPARVIKDENGKELFSGRAAMLPFIEQYNLHQNLKLDQAWDSEHNLAFTEMAIPQFGLTEDGKATLRFPVFPDSIWDDKNEGSDFANVTDGTSNTILMIHAPPEAAVDWADPSPWVISSSNPMRDVFGDREEVEVAMMDGSTRTLRKTEMTNKKLKAMLTISGGEVIE